MSHQPPPSRPSARASEHTAPCLAQTAAAAAVSLSALWPAAHSPPPRPPPCSTTPSSLCSRPRYRFFAQRGDEGAELCFSNAVLKVYGLAEPVEVGISRRFAPGARFWEGFTVDGGSNQMDVTNEARDEEPEKPRLY